LNDVILADPKTATSIQESRTYTPYRTRVIANKADERPQHIFGESGSSLLLVRTPIQFGTDMEESSVTDGIFMPVEILSCYGMTAQNCDEF